MICESINYDQEEKEGYLLNSNRIINLKDLITNIDTFLVFKGCAQERDLKIKLEEEKEQKKIVDYVEDYFQLTASDEQKGIRELHQDFKKKITPSNNFSSGFVLHVYF